MTTISRLIILTGFLAGSSFGYFNFFLGSADEAGSTGSSSSARTGVRAYGLKLVNDTHSGEQSLPSNANILNLLLKYADFSQEEVRAEFDRLIKEYKDEKKHNAGLFRALAYLAYKLGSQSPEEVKKILLNKDFSEYQNFLSPLLEGWAENDFQGAVAYLLEHKQEADDSLYTFNLLITQLVKRDSGLAIQWLSTLTPGERTTALHAMATEFPKNHPDKMGEYLALLTDKDLKSFPLDTLISNWVETDWESAYAWAKSLKGSKKQEAISQAIACLGKTDLAKATEELKKASQPSRDSIGSAMIQNTFDEADRSSGKAFDWVMENKDLFQSPESALQSCFFNYRAQSPEMTSKVIQMEEGSLRDAALGAMVQIRSNMAVNGLDYLMERTTSSTPFQDVLDLAIRISDTSKQNRAVHDCVQDWIRKSPEDARQWITEKSKLPDQDKQNLLDACDKQLKEGKNR